jgi:hypothetical protein
VNFVVATAAQQHFFIATKSDRSTKHSHQVGSQHKAQSPVFRPKPIIFPSRCLSTTNVIFQIFKVNIIFLNGHYFGPSMTREV